MMDGKWWNKYLAPPGRKRTGVASPDELQAELDLDEYWVHRYNEMTGRGGRWGWKDTLSRRIGLAILVVLWLPVLLPAVVMWGFWSLLQLLRECVRELLRGLVWMLQGLWRLLQGLWWLLWGLVCLLGSFLMFLLEIVRMILIVASFVFIFGLILSALPGQHDRWFNLPVLSFSIPSSPLK